MIKITFLRLSCKAFLIKRANKRSGILKYHTAHIGDSFVVHRLEVLEDYENKNQIFNSNIFRTASIFL